MASAAVVLLVSVLGFVGLDAYFGDDPPPAASDRAAVLPAADKSVAVLPFTDLSEGGGQLWLADGISEEILNSLAQTDIKVTARTSSFQFRDQNRDIREIAGRLGVANVVEGSVRVSGDDLRVAAQLIRASDGFHHWSQVYDGTTADLFEFQRNVAERVAVALDVVLDDERRARMFATGTQNVEAFREYQEGWALYTAVHTDSTDQTLWETNKHFERAMALDTRYAQAAIGRTDAFMHFLTEPRLRWVRNSPYTQQEALTRLRETLEFVGANTADSTARLSAQIYRESFSPTWNSMPGLLTQLQQQWDVHSFAFGGGVDDALWLPTILALAGQHDLMRSLAEQHVASDPLALDAWVRKIAAEIHAREFDAARAALAQARQRFGPSALELLEMLIARLEGNGAAAIEIMGRTNPLPRAGAMYLAAIQGDYSAAMAIAREMEERLQDPPGIGWSGLLVTYHEVGETERSRALVKRIDDSLAGAPILARLIADSGNGLFFDLNDAPNFVAKLNQARIDSDSFQQMPRLSTLR